MAVMSRRSDGELLWKKQTPLKHKSSSLTKRVLYIEPQNGSFGSVTIAQPYRANGPIPAYIGPGACGDRVLVYPVSLSRWFSSSCNDSLPGGAVSKQLNSLMRPRTPSECSLYSNFKSVFFTFAHFPFLNENLEGVMSDCPVLTFLTSILIYILCSLSRWCIIYLLLHQLPLQLSLCIFPDVHDTSHKQTYIQGQSMNPSVRLIFF